MYSSQNKAKNQPLRLAVDLRCLPTDGSEGAGIAHASRELWDTLRSLAKEYRVDAMAYCPRGACLEKTEQVRELASISGRTLIRALQNSPADAVLVPSGAVPFGLNLPSFPWVHDLAIFDHPEWFPQSWSKWQITTRLFVRGIRRARHVFSVSDETKRRIVDRTGVNADRITVTGQGVRMCEPEQSEGRSTFLPKKPYALILGTVEPRKNILFLTDLWPEFRRRAGNVRLVVAGSDGWGDVRLPEDPWLTRYQSVSDKARFALMQNADLVLVPSLYEGFGRTALEAMALGIPCVVSDRGALPEIVGIGATVLSLTKPEAWIAALTRIIRDPQTAGQQSWLGRQTAEKFSWEKTVRTMLAKIVKSC